MEVPFEVGRFYKVQIYPSFGAPPKFRSCRCTRVLKKHIHFEYICKDWDGKLGIGTLQRSLSMRGDGSYDAYSNERYSGIGCTNSVKDACDKPSWWDAKMEEVNRK